MSAKPECYGKMFPSLLDRPPNREVRGEVFGYEIQAPGIGVMRRHADFDEAAWNRCLACPEHPGCYRLSTSMLLLESCLNP